MPTVEIIVSRPQLSIESPSVVNLDVVEGVELVALGPFVYAGGGSVQTVTGNAGENVSALRVVQSDGSDLFYADSSTPGHASRIVGVSITSATTGNSLTVQTSGLLSDPSFSFSPGAVYVGSNGVLTSTPPSSGFLCIVGTSVTPTSFVVNLSTPIILL